MEEKTRSSQQVVCFQKLDFDTSKSLWGLQIKFMRNSFFLGNYITLEGAVSHNVLYYQQRYQVSFYAKNYFE